MRGFEMVAQGSLRACERTPSEVGPDQVRIRVAGCGVCHTDLGFFYDGVRTRRPLPLILGHEIAGIVEEAGANVALTPGTPVVVPAVLPCGTCDACLAGHPMICAGQTMPGNDVDGGFATHVTVPGRFVCPVPGASSDPDAPMPRAPGLTLRGLAVIADAVSTPLQAIVRSGLARGDVAIIIGLGGVGGYAAQIAALEGALVIGIDVDADKLAAASALGVSLAIDPRAEASKAVRERIRNHAKANGAPRFGWRIYECSGTLAGQSLAFDLLGPGAVISIVGFTAKAVEVRLSNLMAFDARAIGNWGCDPALYPRAIELATSGRLEVASRIELRPLDRIEETFTELHHHAGSRRVVLVP